MLSLCFGQEAHCACAVPVVMNHFYMMPMTACEAPDMLQLLSDAHGSAAARLHENGDTRVLLGIVSWDVSP